jgi:hypothetical protein
LQLKHYGTIHFSAQRKSPNIYLLKKQKQGNIYICCYGIFGGGGTVHEVKKITQFSIGWV